MSRGDLPVDRQPYNGGRVQSSQGAAIATQDWYRQAYRQMIDKDKWQQAEQVDAQTQAMLEAMPEKAAGQYFKDPDGNFRMLSPQQREDPKVMQHRLSSVPGWIATLPKKERTQYGDLANLGDDQPHPGEEEQVAAWMSEQPHFDPKVDSLGTKLRQINSDKVIQMAKAPMVIPRFLADVPLDQVPPFLPPVGGGGKQRVPPERGSAAGKSGKELSDRKDGHQINLAAVRSDGSQIPADMPANQNEQPYPSYPWRLPLDEDIPALGLSRDDINNMQWVELANRLKEMDRYEPRDFLRVLKRQEPRQNQRRGTSPEVAAQDAIDAAHELNIAKGRDWATDLPRNDPIAIMGQYEHAVDTLVKEAGDFWTERVRREPMAAEIEMMRAYVEPRIVDYFPTGTQYLIKKKIGLGTTLPKIQDGPQGAKELVTALAFGQIKEVTINGEKIDLAEIQPEPQLASRTDRGVGSWGGPKVQRLNYLLGQSLTKYLETCKEISKADVVGGPTKPLPDGTFDGPSEAFFQNPFSSGTKGSARTDLAVFMSYGDQECLFSINTVDVNGKGALTARELRNLLRAIAHAGAMSANWEDSRRRWNKTLLKERRIAPNNAFATVNKPVDKGEAELLKAIEDLLSRLTCAKIIAACKEGNGLVNTAVNSNE